MYFLHAINSDRQTRLLNVLGQIAMIHSLVFSLEGRAWQEPEPSQ